LVQPPLRSNARCPNCGSPLQIRPEQLIDVGRDPASKSRLLSGTLNRIQCPVCSWEGQVASPLVYHDPSKELLLTYIPVELGLPKAEQERLIGQLINEAISRLPGEQRKAYLLQPQAVLTLQGLVERVLEEDGITREQLDEQRARLRLLEDVLRTPDENLPAFVGEHDAEFDDVFFQLAGLSVQTARDQQAARAAGRRLDRVLELSTYGRKLLAQQAEIQAAAESLRGLPEPVTREAVLDLLIQAPNEDRESALATLARPVLDYLFFQTLSERIGAADADSREKLAALRNRLLKITQEIDAAQEARLAAASARLQALIEADDLDQAIQASLPGIDELFLNLLAANLAAAQERGDMATFERLAEIDRRLKEIIAQSLPPALRLAQEVAEEADEAAALKRIDESGEAVTPDFLSTLLAMSQRLSEAGDNEGAERLERLHRHAVGVSMRRKMSGGAGQPAG
jgi:hypothetical protein